VLSDNKINAKSLINEEVYKITECFLGHFYNIEDIFLKNIQLITPHNYWLFFKEN